MKKSFLFGLAAAAAIVVVLAGQPAFAAGDIASPVIRKTGPAPVISDAERQTELAGRRARVLGQMPDDSVLVLLSSEPKIYSNSVDFMYRQENNLYYLTALKQNGATLVLFKKGGKSGEVLFIPKRNPQFETWNGRMYSNADAIRLSGVKTIADAAEQPAFLAALAAGSEFASQTGTAIPGGFRSVYLLLPEDEEDENGNREFRQEAVLAKRFAGRTIVNAREIFARLRLVKSPLELKIMRHAIAITTEAQMRAMAAAGSANWEYEVQAEVEYTFRRRNADYWGYPSIVGCGPNATTLHYVESQGAIRPGELLLMDVGAEYDHYTADVTRTFPVNGRFTKEQAEIYRIVYDAQEAAAAGIRPGARFSDVSRAAARTIEEGLAKLGLIERVGATYPRRMADGRVVQAPQYTLWFMHGLGHWLGMNVHDVGDYSTPMQPGTVMTNEPGIYIREDALDYFDMSDPRVREMVAKIRPAFEKYKKIGVRIEDDMLVTENGVEWMTSALPRKLEDVEAFLAKSRSEMKGFRPALFQTAPTAVFTGSEPLDWHPANGRTVRRGISDLGSRDSH